MKEDARNLIGVCKECSDERHAGFQKQFAGLVLKPGAFAKIGYRQGKNTEHMWFKVLGPVYKEDHVGTPADKYVGELNNDPFVVDDIKNGDKYEFTFAEVEQALIPKS